MYLYVCKSLLCSFFLFVFFVVVVAIDTRDEEGEAKKKAERKVEKKQ